MQHLYFLKVWPKVIKHVELTKNILSVGSMCYFHSSFRHLVKIIVFKKYNFGEKLTSQCNIQLSGIINHESFDRFVSNYEQRTWSNNGNFLSIWFKNSKLSGLTVLQNNFNLNLQKFLLILGFKLLTSFCRIIHNKLGNPALPKIHIFIPAVYPHLNDFTGKLNFRF